MADNDSISRVAALNAARAGGNAQREGKAASECPHNVAGDPDERFLASFWVKGHTAAASGAST